MPASWLEDLDYAAIEAAYLADITSEQNYFGLCWPNVCQVCKGHGFSAWTEAHGERMSELCAGPQCTADGYCPRCGKMSVDNQDPDASCDFCGWQYGDGIPAR